MDHQMKNMIVGFVMIIATFAILMSTTLAAIPTTTAEKDAVIPAEAFQFSVNICPHCLQPRGSSDEGHDLRTEKDVAIPAEAAVQANLKMNPSSNSIPDTNDIVKMKKAVVSNPVLDHDDASSSITTTTEKDVISAEAVQTILKMNPSSNSIPDINEIVKMKTVVSSSVLDPFILKHHGGGSHGGSDDQVSCGESCAMTPCFMHVVGCVCSQKVCYMG